MQNLHYLFYGTLFLLCFFNIRTSCANPSLNTSPLTIKAAAQNTVPSLTLREAILLAMRNNPNIHNAELQRIVDKFSLAIAHNQFSPQLTLNGQALYQNNSLANYSAFPSISLKTPLGIQINSNLTPTLSNNPANNPTITSNATISITQPLLRGFGSDVNKAGLYNANDTEKINQLAFKSQIIDVIINVINSYYQLVQAQNNLQIDRLSLQDAQSMLKQTLKKIKVGKMAAAAQIPQQSSIANLQLVINNDLNTVTQSYQNLLTILGLDPKTNISITTQVDTSVLAIPTLSKCIDIGLANNTSYQQALLTREIIKRALSSAKDAQKWQLDAIAAVSQPINNSGTNLSKSLTLNLNIPIHDLLRQQQLVNTKISLQQTDINLLQQKRQLIADITNSYRAIAFNQEQVRLYACAIDLAKQNLKIIKLQFNYGKTSMFELLTLQNTLINMQINYIAQQIQYQITLEMFYRLLGTTLNKWGIVYGDL